MVDSNRLAAIKQLCTYLETEITEVNGYQHTLTDKVFRGRYRFGDEDPIPMISFLEAPNADENPLTAGWSEDSQKSNWTLLLQGWVADDDTNPTDPAHNLMADVKKALGKFRLAYYEQAYKGTPFDNVDQILIEPGVVRPADEVSNKAYFWMRVVLGFSELVSQPFWIV